MTSLSVLFSEETKQNNDLLLVRFCSFWPKWMSRSLSGRVYVPRINPFFLSSALLPRLNRSRLQSCSGSSTLPRDQEVQGRRRRGSHVDRWATLLLLLLLQLSPDLWPLNLCEWLSSWQHKHLTCSLPQWCGRLSLCCSENDSKLLTKKNKQTLDHTSVCVSLHTHSPIVYSSSFFFFFFLFMLHWFLFKYSGR